MNHWVNNEKIEHDLACCTEEISVNRMKSAMEEVLEELNAEQDSSAVTMATFIEIGHNVGVTFSSKQTICEILQDVGLRRRSSSAAFCHIKDVRCETNLHQLWRQVFCSCRSEAVEQTSS